MLGEMILLIIGAVLSFFAVCGCAFAKSSEKNRYCAIVIGDKYSNSQITPIGFICMELFLKKGFILKAIIVKNFGETEGKDNVHSIWRYRALSARPGRDTIGR